MESSRRIYFPTENLDIFIQLLCSVGILLNDLYVLRNSSAMVLYEWRNYCPQMFYPISTFCSNSTRYHCAQAQMEESNAQWPTSTFPPQSGATDSLILPLSHSKTSTSYIETWIKYRPLTKQHFSINGLHGQLFQGTWNSRGIRRCCMLTWDYELYMSKARIYGIMFSAALG